MPPSTSWKAQRQVDAALRRDRRLTVAAARHTQRAFRQEARRVDRAVSAAPTDAAAVEAALAAITPDLWEQVLLRIWSDILRVMWDETWSDLAPEVTERPNIPGLTMTQIRLYARRHGAAIADTSRRELMRVVEDGMKVAGDSVVRRAIRALYGRFSRRRAVRVALTEVLQATATAQHLTARTIAAVTRSTIVKTWNTVGDLRVREAHQEAEGQRRNLEDPFIVGGEPLAHPRDPAGSPWNVINCRCWDTLTRED